MENLKYPVGKYQRPTEFTKDIKKELIAKIEQLPELLIDLIGNLTKEEYEFVYRPDGWNIRQVVHHIADSHMNAFVRLKLSLTEENPTIKPYDENAFVQLDDCTYELVDASIAIIKGLHSKWTALFRSMSDEDFEKTYFHPESKKEWMMKDVLALYAWHGEHHLAHIKNALLFRGEFDNSGLVD